jgi:t-SNARE complex subunit (syntaxin)
MTEDDLLRLIAVAEVELHNAALAVSSAKRAHTHAETSYLEAKLCKDRLLEELRVYRITTVDYEMDYREKDIARFKKALPDILKNDKWNK